MNYTPEQVSQIVAQYWKESVVRCPADGCNALMDINFDTYFGSGDGGGYLISGHCPRCNRRVKADKKSDPAQSQFRNWTEAEKKKTADGYYENRSATCPVCEASISFNPSAEIGGGWLAFHCLRCGNVGSFNSGQN